MQASSTGLVLQRQRIDKMITVNDPVMAQAAPVGKAYDGRHRQQRVMLAASLSRQRRRSWQYRYNGGFRTDYLMIPTERIFVFEFEIPKIGSSKERHWVFIRIMIWLKTQ